MRYLYLFITLFFVNISFAQQQVDPCLDVSEGYDVILVAGQSNTHYGYPLDAQLDTVNAKVYAIHRQSGMDYRIDKAKPALDFWTKSTNRNSFAITFSNLYATQILTNSNRKVLIIPAGYSGSSILNWKKGGNLYKDAMERLNYVLDNIHGSRLVAILWHHGEANVGWAPYQETLDTMIADMRSDIHQQNVEEVPFVLGGMVPYWVSRNPKRGEQQAIIKDTPNRVNNTRYADPEFPTVIDKPNNGYDEIHFDAAGQREMGKRYFNAFNESNGMRFKVSITRYHEFEYKEDDLQEIPVDKIEVTANKNIQSAIIYNANNTPVLTVDEITSNSFSVEVETLPLDNQAYQLKITDVNDFTHSYRFYR
ncbi:sialate O-acetylesterase [Myroides sp. TSA_177.3]|uniref:sialate O-acetylesterase n=1 Tax=Myroides sp. TSA_177.3 TaxID=3415650 RepID=UPI00404652D4